MIRGTQNIWRFSYGPCANELGSVLHKFYEGLVHILVQKMCIPLDTHNKDAKKDWRGNICIVYITCVNEIVVPKAYLSILHSSLYQPRLYAREFFKYQLSWQSKILIHKEPSWYLSSRSVFHQLNKSGDSIQLLVLMPSSRLLNCWVVLHYKRLINFNLITYFVM